MAVQKVPFIDLRGQYEAVREEIDSAIREVMESSAFVLCEVVEKFEQEIASYCGSKYAVGLASGTDALILSMRALGIGEGDEVIVPAFTFVATVSAVVHAGARPVFVDVEPESFNLNAGQIREKLFPHVRAIIPVHLYGLPADMDPLLELARDRGLLVIEDVAQALGAQYRGSRVGSLGDVGCLSFYPTKNLGGAGDGGMVVADNEELAQQLRLLRNQADASVLGGNKYHHDKLGYNSRLDSLQAAILRAKLPHLEAWNRRRAEHAAHYRALLDGLPVVLPTEPEGSTHVYDLFTIRVVSDGPLSGSDSRDQLQAHLASRGIGSAVYYPIPLHLQGAFSDLGHKEGDFPVSERLCQEVLSLPICPELSEEQIATVAEAIKDFFG